SQCDHSSPLGASFRLKTYSWGRAHGGFGRNAKLPSGFGGPYVVGKLTLRNGARIIEKTWLASLRAKAQPSGLLSRCGQGRRSCCALCECHAPCARGLDHKG